MIFFLHLASSCYYYHSLRYTCFTQCCSVQHVHPVIKQCNYILLGACKFFNHDSIQNSTISS